MTLIEPSQRAVPLTITNDYLPVIVGINQPTFCPAANWIRGKRSRPCNSSPPSIIHQCPAWWT